MCFLTHYFLSFFQPSFFPVSVRRGARIQQQQQQLLFSLTQAAALVEKLLCDVRLLLFMLLSDAISRDRECSPSRGLSCSPGLIHPLSRGLTSPVFDPVHRLIVSVRRISSLTVSPPECTMSSRSDLSFHVGTSSSSRKSVSLDLLQSSLREGASTKSPVLPSEDEDI